MERTHKTTNFAGNKKNLNMTKRVLAYTVMALMAMSVPAVSHAAEAIPMEQVEQAEVNVVVKDKAVYVTGAAGQKLYVVSSTGRVVSVVEITSPSQRVELNIPKGCYIVKVGSVARKVSLR